MSNATNTLSQFASLAVEEIECRARHTPARAVAQIVDVVGSVETAHAGGPLLAMSAKCSTLAQ